MLSSARCGPRLLWSPPGNLLLRPNRQDLRSRRRDTPSDRDSQGVRLSSLCLITHCFPKFALSYFLFELCSLYSTFPVLNIQLTTKSNRHEGAVWSVSWAHPKYGNILASASYDGKVFIWRETNSQWTRIYDFALHTASVNTLSWAPHESGCLLACASSDGNVSVLEFKDNSMDHKIFHAHGIGVNGVSWAPSTSAGSLVSAAGGQTGGGQRRFVTGGSDNVLKIWAWDAASQSYKQEGEPLTGHSDWVRDVAWSPSVLQRSYVASASQDKTVRIWTSDPSNPNVWYVHFAVHLRMPLRPLLDLMKQC